MFWTRKGIGVAPLSVLGAALFVAQLLTMCAIIHKKVDVLREQKNEIERLTNEEQRLLIPLEDTSSDSRNGLGSDFAPDYLFVDAQCEHKGLEMQIAHMKMPEDNITKLFCLTQLVLRTLNGWSTWEGWRDDHRAWTHLRTGTSLWRCFWGTRAQ